MSNPIESNLWANGKEDPTERNERIGVEFMRFVSQGGYSADQLRRAYEIVSGKAEVTDERSVQEGVTEMKKMLGEGFPIHYLDEAIQAKEKDEQLKKNFDDAIEGMKKPRTT